MNVGPNKRIAGEVLSTRVWLAVAESGGWWTAMELRDHFDAEGDIFRINNVLRAMVERGELAKMGGLHPKYGIRPHCIVPRGVRCDVLMKAMGVAA